MHDPYHPAGRPRAHEQPAARRATPVRIRHMLLHFGAIGRGPGDARRCPRGTARGRAPMNRTASDSADCPAPFRPTPDAAMHAGSPAVHRIASHRGTARHGTARKRRNARGRSVHRIGEIPPIDASGSGFGRTACRAPALQCAAAQLAGTLRRVVTRRAAAPACPVFRRSPPRRRPKRFRSTVAPLSGKPHIAATISLFSRNASIKITRPIISIRASPASPFVKNIRSTIKHHLSNATTNRTLIIFKIKFTIKFILFKNPSAVLLTYPDMHLDSV